MKSIQLGIYLEANFDDSQSFSFSVSYKFGKTTSVQDASRPGFNLKGVELEIKNTMKSFHKTGQNSSIRIQNRSNQFI